MSTDARTMPTDLHATYDALRRQGPVVPHPGLGERETLLVTRHDDVAAALADPRLRNDDTDVPGAEDTVGGLLGRLGLPAELAYLGRGLLTRDDADHMRLRRLVSRAFTARRVLELRPRVEALTGALLDDLAAATAGGRPADLMTTFAYPLPVAVICELVGVPAPGRDRWQELGRLLIAPDPERMPDVARGIVAAIEELVAARRESPRDDLVTALVQAHDGDDRLSTREMVTMIFDLVIAGHETTARLLGAATVALLTRPEQLAALRAEPDLWPNAVHELVRTSGPIPVSVPRYAAEDLEIGGSPVPAGSTVHVGLLSANTDPDTYDDPTALDVRRDTGPGDGHLGFGRGPHYCLGAALARQEAEVALRDLFGRFPTLRLVEPSDGPSPLGPRLLPELHVRTS